MTPERNAESLPMIGLDEIEAAARKARGQVPIMWNMAVGAGVFDTILSLITRVRAAEAKSAAEYKRGLEDAAKVASAFPATYSDGPSMHVENMTAGRIVLDIRALLTKETDNG